MTTPRLDLTLTADPEGKAKSRGTADNVAERFWSRVDQSGGFDACWPWTAATFDTGYGCVWFQGRAQKAHRIAWLLAHGTVGPTERVLHHCDNRPCCNPYGTDHLFIGTMRDNTEDMVVKGRHNRDGRRHLLEAQIPGIRERYAAGGVTLQQLGDEFGVTNICIQYVVKRKTWAYVA